MKERISVRRRARKTSFAAAAVPFLLLISELCFLGPVFLDLMARCRGAYILSEWEASAPHAAEAEKEMERAVMYNQEIAARQALSPFSYQGEEATDPLYESLLNSDGSGVMGFIDIPECGIFLPIVHGTMAGKPTYACGHMYGTSLPAGGPSSKAVLAGHTGLPTAELFTNLIRLSEGDLFTLRLGGSRLCYRVRDIRTVLPEEESAYLQVEEGRDLVTLYTCTPYGINDHRLLVTGERSEGDETGGKEAGSLSLPGSGLFECAVRLFLCLCPPVLTVVLYRLLTSRSGRRKAREHTRPSG